MSETDRPVAAATAQGWEVAFYSAAFDQSTYTLLHCFFMRQKNKTKVITVRKKMVGEGIVTEDFEV